MSQFNDAAPKFEQRVRGLHLRQITISGMASQRKQFFDGNTRNQIQEDPTKLPAALSSLTA